ncbi:MAG: HEPN domain-containing protein [Chloroflexi bacterium]|nr:HEPN domain-containing protein [Chloroflexota bacterium]
MTAPEPGPLSLRWLRYAQEDLRAADLARRGELVPRLACFHAQQAAEKAMKAALVLDGVGFPFSHDLRVIRNLLPDDWPAEVRSADLAQLTVWGAESRYPWSWNEPNAENAAEAATEARMVYDAIAGEFARRGMNAE